MKPNVPDELRMAENLFKAFQLSRTFKSVTKMVGFRSKAEMIVGIFSLRKG